MTEAPAWSDPAAWESKVIRSSMRWLPQWVKEEYLDFMWETLGPGGDFRDDAEISVPQRLEFYEMILGNVTSAPVWEALEQNRWLVAAHFSQGRSSETEEQVTLNQVADLLQAAHMAFRGFTQVEAMKKTDRNALGSSIAASASALASDLESLWLASDPDERSLPFAIKLPHGELHEILNVIAEGATEWVAREPVLQRPGRGDAARRYFIISMADWFETLYSAQMEDGTRLSKRLDNVTTALVNCLFPEGVLDQSTVAKIIGVSVQNRSA